MHTTIKSGLPCLAIVTYIHAGRAARTCAEVDDCYPEDAPEVEFELYTLGGRKAPWMHRLMTESDYLRISRALIRGHS